AEDGIRDWSVTGVEACAPPVCRRRRNRHALTRFGRARLPHRETWSFSACRGAVQTVSGENLGRRFPRKAAAPSGASWPLNPRNSMPSEASKIGPAARSQLLSAYLVQRIAVGPPSPT